MGRCGSGSYRGHESGTLVLAHVQTELSLSDSVMQFSADEDLTVLAKRHPIPDAIGADNVLHTMSHDNEKHVRCLAKTGVPAVIRRLFFTC